MIVLCRGAHATFGGSLSKDGRWLTWRGEPITNPIIGWEYIDGKARGKYRGNRIVGIYLQLRPRKSTIERVVVVK